MIDQDITSEFENEILELINDQLRNDEDSLTQSDLQGVVTALVNRILEKGKELK